MHFAVSNAAVEMTTRLAGLDTRFLPFNQGHDGGAGNPPNPAGIATDYLWREGWQRDSWLQILGRSISRLAGSALIQTRQVAYRTWRI